MKIAIIGPHNCGKTTLISKLNDIYPDVFFIQETARIIFNKYNITGRKNILDYGFNNLSNILHIQQEIIKLQIEIEASYESFISDRSILDIIAYSFLYAGPAFYSIYKNNYMYYKEYTKNNYTCLLLIHPFSKPTESQKIILNYIFNLLLDYKLPYYEVITPDINQRLNIITQVINKFK